MAALYTLIARKIPAMEGFWQALAAEERAHATVLASLVKLEAVGDVVFQSTAFQSKATLVSIEFVDNKIRQIEAQGIGIPEAMRLAIDLEQSMLESRFFDVFEAGSTEMRSEFAELRRHTVDHISRIAEAFTAKGG
ncbi:MAG: hypothetical protein WCL44_02745 [bacterium]